MRYHTLVSSFSIVVLILGIVSIQSNKEKEVYVPNKEELPYIACDVCKKSMKYLFEVINEAREVAPFKKLDEVDIVERLDELCNPTNETGSWIRYQDIAEDKLAGGNRHLRLIEPGGKSKCKEECTTIAKSCEVMFEDDIDRDDISAMLWRNKIKSVDEFQV